MARKPNYQFERMERDRQKALKKAEKAAQRDAAKGPPPGDDAPPPADET